MPKLKNIYLALIVLGLMFLPLAPMLAETTVKLQVPLYGTNEISGEASTILPTYIGLWFNLVVGTAGVLAAIYIMWGAFKWLTAAGNAATIKDAQETIYSAVAGLIIALLAYSILYIINPNLIKLQLPGLSSTTYSTEPATPPTTQCKQTLPTSNPCSEQYINSVLNSHPEIKKLCSNMDSGYMSQICRIESSGGVPTLVSGTDKCKDGTSFSYGLFQINIAAQGQNIQAITNSSACTNLIINDSTGQNGKPLQYSNGRQTYDSYTACKDANPGKFCYVSKWDCRASSSTSVAECKKLLFDPETSILLACKIYGREGYNAWPVSNKKLQACTN
ncbi:MAG: hypothetical protein WCW02_03705 [Candidatus Buchananbacteria bacterium]